MKKILFLFLSVFLLNSCGESSGDLVGLNDFSIGPGSGGNTKVIKKITVAESGSVPYDIIYNWNAGKLTSITTSDNSLLTTIEYNGSLISKITEVSGQGAQTTTTTSNLVYNGTILTDINGVSTASGVPAQNFKTSVFYTGTYPTLVKTDLYQPNSTTLIASSVNTNLEFSGNNIAKMTYAMNLFGTTITAISTFSNYDANPNPLHTLPMAYTLATTNSDADTFGPLGLSFTNYKTITVQSGGATQTENVVYTYGTDNYPTKSVQPSVTLSYEYISI